MMTQEYEPTDLAGQERTAEQSAAEERRQRELRQNDLRWAMSTKQGRRFIYRQLSEAGIWLSSFDADTAVMAFREGRRNGGLQLLSEIMEACPERYTDMLTEQQEAKERNDNRNADSRNRRR